MMVRSSSVSVARRKRSCTTETAKNSTQLVFLLQVPFPLIWARRATYIKGDPYIRDMKHTRSIIHITLRRLWAFSLTVVDFLCSGHVSELTSCSWHPKNSEVFITSSADSTIRYVLSLAVSSIPSFALPFSHRPFTGPATLPHSPIYALTTAAIPPKRWVLGRTH